MKKWTLVLAIITSSVLWGCGRRQNSVVGPLSGAPTTTTPGTCTPGQVLTANNQCLNQYACNVGFGFDGSTCVPGTPVDPGTVYQGPSQGTFGATLSITSRHGFENFLERVGGVCNFSNFFAFSLFGPDPFDCATYSRQGFILLQLFSNPTNVPQVGPSPAYITIGAGATSPADGLYGGMYGGSGYRTIPLNMQSSPINKGAGFELRVDGGFFGGFTQGFASSSITIRAENADISRDSNIHIVLYHNSREFARSFTARQ